MIVQKSFIVKEETFERELFISLCEACNLFLNDLKTAFNKPVTAQHAAYSVRKLKNIKILGQNCSLDIGIRELICDGFVYDKRQMILIKNNSAIIYPLGYCKVLPISNLSQPLRKDKPTKNGN